MSSNKQNKDDHENAPSSSQAQPPSTAVVGEGTSQLMGLFAPPPPSSTGSAPAAAPPQPPTPSSIGSSQQPVQPPSTTTEASSSSSLLGLFQPPPPPKSTTTTKTTSPTKLNQPPSVPPGGSGTASTAGSSSLLGLFAPPPLPPASAPMRSRSAPAASSSSGSRVIQSEPPRVPTPSTANTASLSGLFAPPSSSSPSRLIQQPPQQQPPTPTAGNKTSSLSGLFEGPIPTTLSSPTKGFFLPEDGPIVEDEDEDDTVIAGPVRLSYQNDDNIIQPQESTALLSSGSCTVQDHENEYYIGTFDRDNELHPQQRSSQDDDDDDDHGDHRQAFLVAKAFPSQKHLTTQNGLVCCNSYFSWLQQFQKKHLQPTTFAGSFMFVLYHVVFCLANGSAMIRPHAMDRPILGLMAKLTTVGIICAGPVYIQRLGHDIPALYPSVDLFLAPFISEAVRVIDQSLFDQYNGSSGGTSYPDSVFFATFAVLTGIGMFLAGSLLQLAATFKLANLGTYLPYSVLCGFFSAVGVLLWALAFSVDTSGKTWKAVFFSGDWDLIGESCLHHFPSLVVGILMNKLGPKHPFFVILLIFVTLIVFYSVMWITGTSLSEAQQAEWFWSAEELVYHPQQITTNSSSTVQNGLGLGEGIGLDYTWILPPTPFCSIMCLLSTSTNWKAVYAGLGNMAALAFLYLLRSSIHASALKKNIGNLVRRIPQQPSQPPPSQPQPQQDSTVPGEDTTTTSRAYNAASSVFGSMRQGVQIVNLSLTDTPNKQTRVSSSSSPGTSKITVLPAIDKPSLGSQTSGAVEYDEIRAKPSRRGLEEIFSEYALTLYTVAVCGGFGNCPTVATSNTMYAIGAEGPAPQYGSLLLLLIFYFTNFEIVQYIPKAAFSSLLVLGAVDTLVVWFFGAFRKTLDLAEWMVVPIIVAFSLVVGFLNAVYIGIGISLFVFVAAFFRVGVVKYNATGLEIRSRIERSMAQSLFLDSHGDFIQILVLQNYLFFGNASSILSYITTMFEEVDRTEYQALDFSLPPMPNVLIVDLSLITGMDTSTVDIFADIKELCKSNDCKLFLCGLSPRMRKGLALGGVKPDVGLRSKRTVRLFPDLDTALGRAEDFLIETEMEAPDVDRRSMGDPDNNSDNEHQGFRYALRQIDELHGQNFAEDLFDLQHYVVSLQLEAGNHLFESTGGLVSESQRGLFFIESGLLKTERDTSQTTMNRTMNSAAMGSLNAVHTLKHQHARMGTVARKAALAKSGIHGASPNSNIRVARIGPGWVVGTLENASGMRPTGTTVAVTACRLHHLPFHVLEDLEKENPMLVLRLYKMLSHLMARKEEITIEHLSTLHNIMSSPAHSKPISRSTITRLMANA